MVFMSPGKVWAGLAGVSSFLSWSLDGPPEVRLAGKGWEVVAPTYVQTLTYVAGIR